MKTLKFTNAESLALLHRLSAWDCICEVFADTDDMEHLSEPAAGRTQELHDQLAASRTVVVDETSELDRQILTEAIEGSTWVAIHDPLNDTNNSHQKMTAAYYALVHAAKKIASAFGFDPHDIEVPRG